MSEEEEYTYSDEVQDSHEKLLAENKKLREQIRALKNMEDAVEYDKSLKVVGKGAKRFNAELQELNNKLQMLEKQKK